MRNNLLIVIVLIVVAGGYIHLVKPEPTLLERPLAEIPISVNDWYMVKDHTFSESVMKVLRPTDYLSRQYRNAKGDLVTLYIGYHGGRPGDGGIHSPRNCLPSSGWHQDYFGRAEVPLADGENLNLVNAIMSKGHSKVQFYYWFQVRSWIVTDEYSLKLAEVWNSLTARRRDQCFVRLSTNSVDDENGKKSMALERFVQDFYPIIQSFLPS